MTAILPWSPERGHITISELDSRVSVTMKLKTLLLVTLLCSLNQYIIQQWVAVDSNRINVNVATKCRRSKPMGFCKACIPHYYNSTATFNVTILLCGWCRPKSWPRLPKSRSKWLLFTANQIVYTTQLNFQSLELPVPNYPSLDISGTP